MCDTFKTNPEIFESSGSPPNAASNMASNTSRSSASEDGQGDRDVEDAAPGRIRNAVEIAADAHHAFVGEAPFELQDRSIGDKRQRVGCAAKHPATRSDVRLRLKKKEGRHHPPSPTFLSAHF
jgi:hypothetical protein